MPHLSTFRNAWLRVVGAVELENLLLKKDALKKLNLPIEVKFGEKQRCLFDSRGWNFCCVYRVCSTFGYVVGLSVRLGYIGKLKLQIPVRYIKSQPWVVEINELFILVGPAANVKVSTADGS